MAAQLTGVKTEKADSSVASVEPNHACVGASPDPEYATVGA
ncbi:hypothetical protein [Haladaptatus sp. ZSTT2]